MKLGIFADAHYCKAEVLCHTRRPSLSLAKIKAAMDAFADAQVELVICMGDLIDKGETPEEPVQCLTEAMNVIRSYGIPYYILPGNHDYAAFNAEAFSARTKCHTPPYVLNTASHLLVFLDANYREDYRRFDVAGVEWKDSNLPPEQLTFLKYTLAAATKPCIVLLHENLDDAVQINHVVKNAADARSIIENSGKVSLVLQGHYHKGADRLINGIRYLTLPAMCEGEDNHYLILDV